MKQRIFLMFGNDSLVAPTNAEIGAVTFKPPAEVQTDIPSGERFLMSEFVNSSRIHISFDGHERGGDGDIKEEPKARRIRTVPE